jgi:hypothetical protein
MPRDAGEAASPVGRRDSGQSRDVPPGIPVPESRSSFWAEVGRAPALYSFENMNKKRNERDRELSEQRRKISVFVDHLGLKYRRVLIISLKILNRVCARLTPFLPLQTGSYRYKWDETGRK